MTSATRSEAGPMRRSWRRCRLAICLTSAMLGAAAALPAHAQTPSAAEASSFVSTTARELITIIDSGEDAASKTRQLQVVVDQVVDAEAIARFCLGRYWPQATPAQREAFLGLFHGVLLEGVAGQIRNYKGVTVTLGRVQPHESDVSVSSVVQRPQAEPANVDWIVERAGAELKIEDIVAEGTSMRLTRRNDYTAFLSSHGGNIDALLAAMRARLSQ